MQIAHNLIHRTIQYVKIVCPVISVGLVVCVWFLQKVGFCKKTKRAEKETTSGVSLGLGPGSGLKNRLFIWVSPAVSQPATTSLEQNRGRFFLDTATIVYSASCGDLQMGWFRAIFSRLISGYGQSSDVCQECFPRTVRKWLWFPGILWTWTRYTCQIYPFMLNKDFSGICESKSEKSCSDITFRRG